jgi:collagenase-like PrtC family protease
MRLISILRSHDQLSKLKSAGANGILLGIDGLSYRTPIYSFDETIDILNQAKAMRMAVYLQLNRLLDEDETLTARVFIDRIAPYGFDGIFFQDLAYVSFCEKTDLKLIYAPEAIITNAKEVDALCANGIDHVMLAKELTMDEIIKIALENPNRTALFGFGHLPMAVSRRPLVRNYLAEINKDNELSKGTKLTLQEAKRSVLFPILEDEKDSIVFADTVFCPLEEIKRLEESGVALLIADDIFVEEEILTNFIVSCIKVLAGQDPKNEMRGFIDSHPTIQFSDGYFHQKTNLTKEGTSL